MVRICGALVGAQCLMKPRVSSGQLLDPVWRSVNTLYPDRSRVRIVEREIR